MAMIRRGSTATGALVFGPFESIQPVTFQKPVPPPTVKAPVVTVHDFDGLITPNAWDMTWDDGNGNFTHISTNNGGIYVEITNSAGSNKTGKYRKIL